jgi:recombinational DNA repair protein RecT
MGKEQTTAIAVTDENVIRTIASWSDKYLRAFYRGRDFDAWKQDVALAIVQSESLRNCLNNELHKAVLLRAIQLNASSGLSLNPQHGEAALVAYNGKKGFIVNHIAMKNGLVKKALETRKVLKIESGTVYEKDEFKVRKSSDGDGYDWCPALKDRGKPSGYFACIALSDGKKAVEYWDYAQVWEHALKYGNGRVWDDVNKTYELKFYPDSAWGKSFNGQAEKTVIRAGLHNLYLPELEETFAEEDKLAEEMRNVTEPQHKGTGAEDLAGDLAAQAENTAPEQPPADPAPAPDKNGEVPLF